MALTLEATLVIPLTMTITVAILSASIFLYKETESNARMESQAFMHTLGDKSLWSCEVKVEKTSNDSIVTDHSADSWTKWISVNPVRERNIIMLAMDMAKGIEDILPVFDQMEDLFFEADK